MDTLLQDLRYAARKLMRSPGFTAVALATLALGIGATTAIFSIVNGVLLKPLPYREPERLVRMASMGRDGGPMAMSVLDFVDYRGQSRSFVAAAPLDEANMNLTGTELQPQRINAGMVGASFFEILGVTPQRGRAFVANEDAKGAAHVVILSDALWRSRFGADPRLVGRNISLDGTPYEVIGIAPPRFSYPDKSDVWVPFVFTDDQTVPDSRGAHSMYGIARLRPNVTIDAARTELTAISRRLESQYATTNTGIESRLQPLQEQIVGDVSRALWSMLGAVLFVLLIACTNVANLLLVRAATRESEIAVRTALGAGRGRLVRQLVTESVLLAVVGAGLGIVLAAWAVDAVVAFGPTALPRLEDVAVDSTVLLFAAVLAVATGLLFGLVPALHTVRSDIGRMLRESARGTSRGGAQRTRGLLVVSELALAVVLLVGAGLLMRSFVRLLHVDPGFRAEHVVSFDVSLPSTKYRYDREVRGFVADLSGRLRQIPGTEAVGVTFGRPLETWRMRTSFDVVGRPPNPPDRRTRSEVHPASPSYFKAMGIDLVRGRLYTDADDRLDVPGTVVVSEEFARKFFPQGDAIGTRITLGISHDTAAVGQGQVTAGGEIVGIVRDVKQFALSGDVVPMVYLPFGTLPFTEIAVIVRSTADPQLVEGAIRARLREVDANLPLYGLTTMEKAVSDSVSQPRFYMILLGVFAGVALLLAAIGIYGVISYAVSLRTRELGIRIALGATRERVVRLVLGQGLWLSIAGITVGLFAAFWLTRAIASLLFGVGALDPITFTVVTLLLVGIALLASYLPARRAARVDPVIAMRAE